MTRVLLLAGLLLAAPASAQERRFVVTDFDRVRVDGAFDVELTTRQAPAAVVEGTVDAADDLDIRVEGTTLIVRSALRQAGERPTVSHGPVRVRIAAPDLRAATIIGGGRLTVVGPVRGQRVDLQVTGSGALVAQGVASEQVNAVLLGSGTMTLGGQAGRARLSLSGQGTIEAAALSAGDLVLRLDGPGTATASARYTANVFTTGVGAATVFGTPACTVKATAGGPIRCGAGSAP